MTHVHVKFGLENKDLDLFTHTESRKLNADEVTILGFILACPTCLGNACWMLYAILYIDQ